MTQPPEPDRPVTDRPVPDRTGTEGTTSSPATETAERAPEPSTEPSTEPSPEPSTESTSRTEDGSGPSGDGAVTERFPVPPPPARRGGPPPHPPQERSPDQDRAAAVLDRPVDDRDLADRLRRPGLARSTRVLLLVLGAVVCLALGAFAGRATAPDTGPGSVPDMLGVVESVQPTGGGYPIVTIRSGDGTMTPLRTTAGTSVAVPRPEGPAGLRVGQQVTVHAERGADGAITAVRVDLPGG